jgi:hypothetical protein
MTQGRGRRGWERQLAAGRRWLLGLRSEGLLGLAAVAAVLLLGAPARADAARGPGVSFTPSRTEPYAVCGRPSPAHAACLAILVPGSSAQSLLGAPAASGLLSPSYSGSGVGGGYAPADLRSAYDLPSATAGTGQTVAIVDAYDDPNAESDLAAYRARYGISACTSGNGCFRKVNQSGGTSHPKANASWAVEISLDLDMASAACPSCHILLVEATSNAYANLFAAEDEAAALGATEISNSWAGEEFSGETSDDTHFHHPGVPITVSAGDEGYGVEYPASSQYVIAVGGTALTQASNSRGWSETAWSGTGSGCSAYEPKPAWQSDTGCARRTDTDLAAVASPETPVSVADSYRLPAEFSKPEPGWTLVGGTSVSSPLIAATMALANAATRSFEGADALYREAAQNGTRTLDDVTSGSNGSCGSYLCNAGPGYDGPTGLGSPYGAPETSAGPSSPPTNTSPPTISGTAQTEQTLTASPGSWSEGPTSYGYEWLRCNASGLGCSGISGAKAQTYKVGPSDVGSTLRVSVTASNSLGPSEAAVSTQTAVVTQAPLTFGKTTVGASAESDPANLKGVSRYALPSAGTVSKLSVYLQPTSVSGQQEFKGVLYAESAGAPGTLLGTSTALVFKSTSSAGWYDLSFPTALKLAAGNYWIGFISGATAGVAAFRYDSVASAMDYNANLFTSGPSNPFGTATVIGLQPSLYGTYAPESAPSSPPTNTSPPTISGTAQTEQTLTASPGSWSEGPTSYGYEWLRCNASGLGCSGISGAKAQTYKVGPSDVGSTLRVSVTASNSLGPSEAAVSTQTAVVTQAPLTFGKTTVGASAESDPANLKGVSRYALPSAGTVSKLSVYLQPTSVSGQQEFKGVLYAESAGAPGTLLGTSTALVFKSTSSAGWYDLSFPTALKLAAGNYWIGFISGATAGVAAFRYDSVASAMDYNANLFTSGPSNPFGTATVIGLQPSLYGTYAAG